MKVINGIPITDRHEKSRISITKTRSAVTLLDAAKMIVENDDISAMQDDPDAMPMSVAFMAACWDVSAEYARKLVLDLARCRE